MIGQKVNKEIEEMLLARGVRPTPNRILVLRELMQASRPMSMGDLEDVLGFTMAKASIFRVLELFAEKDIVHVIEDGSRAIKYELCHSRSAEVDTDRHVHFYCERCKETYCLEDMKVPEMDIPEGYTVRSVNFMIKGLCPRCSDKQ